MKDLTTVTTQKAIRLVCLFVGAGFLTVPFGCEAKKKDPGRTDKKEAFNQACDALHAVQRFCDVLRESKMYQVTVMVTNIVDSTGFQTDVEYELAVLRPNHVNLSVTRGVGGPMIICDGTRLLFSSLLHRNAEVDIKAPDQLSGITTARMIGERASSVMRGSPLLLWGLVEGDPQESFLHDFGVPIFVNHESIDGIECVHVRSENESSLLDAWLEAEDPGMLYKLVVSPKRKGDNLRQVQVYKNWVVDRPIPLSVFDVATSKILHEPAKKSNDSDD
jgi:hypothetical protein